MSTKEEKLEAFIEQKMLKRRLASSTRETYIYWILRISEFFEKYEIEDFLEPEVAEFIKDIELRQDLSASTSKQAASALNFYFNTIGKRGFDVWGMRRKKVQPQSKYVPSQEEVLKIIDAIPSKRSKIISMLIYSTGIGLDEAKNIKLTDIDFDRNVIRIPSRRGKGSRNAILAEYVKPELYSYIRNSKPKKWVFESKTGNQFESSTVQKAIAQASRKLEIKHPVSPISLKYAYVKHMEALGIHLFALLTELNLSIRSSLEFYSKLNDSSKKISFSPIDRRVSKADIEKTSDHYVSISRTNELSEVVNSNFDFTRLLQLIVELNSTHHQQLHFSTAMIVRAIIDHVPPIFGCSNFIEVSNNYAGSSSFKKSMKHLQQSLRNIADSFLHVQIRNSEVLPTSNQVDFKSDLDVLLAEVIRVAKKT